MSTNLVSIPCTLRDLDARWVDWDHVGRRMVALEFRCPHCEFRIGVYLRNPLDGGPPVAALDTIPHWQVTWRSGLDDLSLYPSIDWAGHFHVSVAGGQVMPA